MCSVELFGVRSGARTLGVEDVVMPRLVEVVCDVMGDHYSELQDNLALVKDVVGREEEQFRRTLATGSQILDEAVTALEQEPLPGSIAFQLHDTFGFPVEVTQEILSERDLTLDKEGFDTEMDQQRERARSARADGPTVANETYRQILEQFDVTEFIRDSGVVGDAQVLAVVELDDEQVEVFLDKTPFYAESGGQIGDTGTIRTESELSKFKIVPMPSGAASTRRSSSGRDHSFTLHGYGGYRRRAALGYAAKSHRNTHPSLGFKGSAWRPCEASRFIGCGRPLAFRLQPLRSSNR